MKVKQKYSNESKIKISLSHTQAMWLKEILNQSGKEGKEDDDYAEREAFSWQLFELLTTEGG